MKQCKVITFKYDVQSGLSIPDKTEIIESSNSNSFTLAEIASIAQALLMIEPPKQVKQRI